MSRWTRGLVPLIVGAATFGIDLWSKEWALRALWPPQTPYSPYIRVIPGCFDLLLAMNKGAAFSMLESRPWVIPVFAGLATFGIFAWCVWWIAKGRRDSVLARIAFGLILGGAIGNLIDRVRFQAVVDFFHAYIRIGGREYAWPTFNVADCGIVVGVALFLYLSLFTKVFDTADSTADAVAASEPIKAARKPSAASTESSTSSEADI